MKKPLKIILGLIIAGSLGLNIYLIKEKNVFRLTFALFEFLCFFRG